MHDRLTCGPLIGPQSVRPSFDWPVMGPACFLWNGKGGLQAVWFQGRLDITFFFGLKLV